MDKGTALSRDEALDLVRQYKHIIARHFQQEPRVLMYGSYSKGNANRDSDIDVAVVVSSYGDRKLELSKALWRDVRGPSIAALRRRDANRNSGVTFTSSTTQMRGPRRSVAGLDCF